MGKSMAQPEEMALAACRRAQARTALALPGLLYVPAKDTCEACTVVDVSSGGAGITCENIPPQSSLVILHIEGFGRFEARCSRFENGILGLKLLVPKERSIRLYWQIAAFLDDGVDAAAVMGLTSVRSP